MTKKIFSLLTLGGAILFIWPANVGLHASTNPSSIVITEIGYTGSYSPVGCGINKTQSCSNDKWFEIYNYSDKDLALDGYKVMVGKNSQTQDYVTSYAFPVGIVLKTKSFLTITSKSLNSTITQASINNIQIGSLFSISSNTSGSKYIKLGITSPDGIADEVYISNLDKVEKDFNIEQLTNKKTSLNLDPISKSLSFSNTEFFSGNFGTPGFSTASTQEGFTNSESIIKQPAIALSPKPVVDIVANNSSEFSTGQSNTITEPLTNPSLVSNTVSANSHKLVSKSVKKVSTVKSLESKVKSQSIPQENTSTIAINDLELATDVVRLLNTSLQLKPKYLFSNTSVPLFDSKIKLLNSHIAFGELSTQDLKIKSTKIYVPFSELQIVLGLCLILKPKRSFLLSKNITIYAASKYST